MLKCFDNVRSEPEVSVMHIGRTLLENIRCKRQVGEVSSHMINFKQVV